MKKFIKSFTDALRGIFVLFKSQRNARIELTVTILVIFFAFIFRIKAFEWLIILACIALVLALEAINTSIEIFADKIHPGHDQEIGKTKDVAAGAVLIASIFAAIIGFIIFAPRFLNLFTNF